MFLSQCQKLGKVNIIYPLIGVLCFTVSLHEVKWDWDLLLILDSNDYEHHASNAIWTHKLWYQGASPYPFDRCSDFIHQNVISCICCVIQSWEIGKMFVYQNMTFKNAISRLCKNCQDIGKTILHQRLAIYLAI